MKRTQISQAERKRREMQGARIAQLRLDKTGLSPEAFGVLVNLDGDTIRKVERGRGPRRPHARTMFAIAAGLEMTTSEVFPPERPTRSAVFA